MLLKTPEQPPSEREEREQQKPLLGKSSGKSADKSSDRYVLSPFTVLVDSREQAPFRFTGLSADANKGNRPILVLQQVVALKTGDYQIQELAGQFAIERKSAEDLYGTLLGFGERRRRFDEELSRLQEMPYGGSIFVEAEFEQCIVNAPTYGKKSGAANGKTLYRTILSRRLKFDRVHWFFASRRLCEITAYRTMEKLFLQHA